MIDLEIMLEKDILLAEGYKLQTEEPININYSAAPTVTDIFEGPLDIFQIYCRMVYFINIGTKVLYYAAYDSEKAEWILTNNLEELPSDCGQVGYIPYYYTKYSFSELIDKLYNYPLQIQCSKKIFGGSIQWVLGTINFIQGPMSKGEMRILTDNILLNSEGIMINFVIENETFIGLIWEENEEIQIKIINHMY